MEEFPDERPTEERIGVEHAGAGATGSLGALAQFAGRVGAPGKIVLHAADGEASSAIAKRLKLNQATVGKWRRRFVTHRLQGLHDELRPGRPRSLEDEAVAELINRALHTKPVAATQWSVRSFAQATKVSPSMAHRLFKLFGLQPHRQESFKLSTDPFFIEKVRDIVGLYLNPPDCALVLSVDEKSQIQALNRTQPMLPMGLAMSRRDP